MIFASLAFPPDSHPQALNLIITILGSAQNKHSLMCRATLLPLPPRLSLPKSLQPSCSAPVTQVIPAHFCEGHYYAMAVLLRNGQFLLLFVTDTVRWCRSTSAELLIPPQHWPAAPGSISTEPGLIFPPLPSQLKALSNHHHQPMG